MISSSSLARALVFIAVAIGMFAWSRTASAYTWMIRHEYSGCNQCHADPSGGGLLTAYGRGQSEILLRTRYGAAADDPGKVGNFLFGAFDLPETVLLGADGRAAWLRVEPQAAPATERVLIMQADLEGQVTVERARANASIGYLHEGGLAASVTNDVNDRLVSRVHWAGFDLGADRQFVLRFGRMNLPFGIRSIEHTAWVRSSTRTDINAAQQDGIALAYNGETVRGEAMLIAGNLQLGPPAFRERGYSAYLEFVPVAKTALGVSSLVTHADRDVSLQTPLWRQAHGIFARYSPFESLVVLAEGDALVQSQPPSARAPATTFAGTAAMLQLDFEPLQGIHAIATGELLDLAPTRDAFSYATWASFAWFFAPRADVRADAIWTSTASGASRSGMTTFVAQLHFFL